jgi:6-phosphogluconate dehydrogenase (decarboxylating)
LLKCFHREPGKFYNVDVKDFGHSWRDGRAFNVLLLNLTPQHLTHDLNSIKDVLDETAEGEGERETEGLRETGEEGAPESLNHKRLQSAFSMAQAKMGVARLLEVEGQFVV